ncbi:MAG: flagellin [Candidatus Lernaella stagnicola]|nr:flagellin [Candidatus Lernaella stagnicola]
MPLRITNNVLSLNAQRQINRSNAGLGRALERLSSGFRINKAGDDAAGLAISEKLRSNIRALGQASRNASDGISMIQTAEGAMDETNNMLVRMKELAEQSANGTLSDTERGFLSAEYNAMLSEITRIADATKFNETNLLDGTLSVAIQIGLSDGSNDTLNIAIGDVDAVALSLTSTISTVGDAQSALGTVSSAIETVATRRSDLGALQNRLESVVNNIDTVVENLTAAESRIRDADIAAETANLTKYSILVQAGISILAQANQSPTVALSLLA